MPEPVIDVSVEQIYNAISKFGDLVDKYKTMGWLTPIAVTLATGSLYYIIDGVPAERLTNAEKENLKTEITGLGLMIVSSWALMHTESELGETACLAGIGIGAIAQVEEVRKGFFDYQGWHARTLTHLGPNWMWLTIVDFFLSVG